MENLFIPSGIARTRIVGLREFAQKRQLQAGRIARRHPTPGLNTVTPRPISSLPHQLDHLAIREWIRTGLQAESVEAALARG